MARQPDGQSEARVLVIGDSLMFQTLPALHRRLALAGVSHLIEAYPGSGLLSHPAPVNWHERAVELVAEYRPTQVVVEFCCNYWPPYVRDDNGALIEPGSLAFELRWGEAAARLRRILRSDGASLYWIITPPTGDLGLNDTLVDPINRTTFAAHAADPALELVDWVEPLTDDNGAFQLELRGKVLRDADLVHFAPDGADVAARAVTEVLCARVRCSRDEAVG